MTKIETKSLSETYNPFSKLNNSAIQAAAAGESLRKVILALNEDSYKKYHRRLPGSLRTKRLRKKRITKIAQWVQKVIL